MQTFPAALTTQVSLFLELPCYRERPNHRRRKEGSPVSCIVHLDRSE